MSLVKNKRPIEETGAFQNVMQYLKPAEQEWSYEVLKGLEGIVSMIKRGDVSADTQDAKYFEVLLELYKSHFDLSRYFADVKGLPLRKPKYAEFMAGSLVNLLLDYKNLLTGEIPKLEKIVIGIKEDEISDTDVIPQAKNQFNRFKEYTLRALANGDITNLESVDALRSISNVYEEESKKDNSLIADYLFFASVTKLAEHLTRLSLIFTPMSNLDFSAHLDKYNLGKEILDLALSTSNKYYKKFRA